MATDRTPHDRYVDADGLRLHYLDWGNDAAPPMLLLHGCSGPAHTWDAFARAMCDRYHVVALDQRGHGDSDWAKDGAYRPDNHAPDIRAVHDKLGLRAVVLIGLSMGGRNSIALTAAHPATVEKLVIADIWPGSDPRGAASIARMAGDAAEDFGSVDEAVAYLRPHVTVASSAGEAALRHRVEHGVKKLPSGRYTWKSDGFLRDQRRRGTVPPVD